MLRPIRLHFEPRGRRVELHEARGEHNLPPKRHAKLRRAQALPEHALGFL